MSSVPVIRRAPESEYNKGASFAKEQFGRGCSVGEGSRFGNSVYCFVDASPLSCDDFTKGFMAALSDEQHKIEALPLFATLKAIRESDNPNGLELLGHYQFIDYVHGQSIALTASALNESFTTEKAQSLGQIYRSACYSFKQGMAKVIESKLNEFHPKDKNNDSADTSSRIGDFMQLKDDFKSSPLPGDHFLNSRLVDADSETQAKTQELGCEPDSPK